MIVHKGTNLVVNSRSKKYFDRYLRGVPGPLSTQDPRRKLTDILTMSTNRDGLAKHTQTDIQPARDEETPLLRGQEQYSTFSNRQKKYIIMTAALASTFSPFSANIYYPALNSIATDLHISASLINLTITTYMVSLLLHWWNLIIGT